jgi:hypothetical protein
LGSPTPAKSSPGRLVCFNPTPPTVVRLALARGFHGVAIDVGLMMKLAIVAALVVAVVIPVAARASPKPAGFPDQVMVNSGNQAYALYWDLGAALERYDSNPASNSTAATSAPYMARTAGSSGSFAMFINNAGTLTDTGYRATFNSTTQAWSGNNSLYSVTNLSGGYFARPAGFGVVDLVAEVVGSNRPLLYGSAAALLMVALVVVVLRTLRRRLAFR